MQNLHMTMHAQLNLIHIYDFYAKDLLTKKQNISSNNRRSELYPFCPCQITSRRSHGGVYAHLPVWYVVPTTRPPWFPSQFSIP